MGGQAPRVHHLLHQGMVARARQDLALAQQVQARIADVRPVGAAFLHHAGDHRGARRFLQPEVRRFAQQHAVRAPDRAEQEQVRVGEARARVAAEGGGDVAHDQFGGDLAVRVAAHAVAQHQQHGFGGAPVAGAVLVVGPPADARVLGDGEFHLPASLSRAPFSCSNIGVSPWYSGAF